MSIQKTSIHALPGEDTISRTVLKNGITVLVRENFSSPSVVVDGMLRGGALWEPEEKAGLANFHSELLMRGTKDHTFRELFEEIEGIGASLDVGSGGHTYSFDLKSLAEDLPLMLGLLAEVLREPTFPEDHIEKVRGEILTGLQMRAFSTRSMASLKFQELAYPDHPYRFSVSGYPETVATITRDNLVEFQRKFGPQGAIIVVAGAVKAADAVRMVESVFADWENPNQEAPPEAPPAAPIREPRRMFVPIPGKSQVDIALGFPGPARSASDFQAARMANSILGVFGLMGRLGDNVREDQGLAYYSYSQLTGGMGPGPWKVSAGVDPGNVDRAIDSILVEIQRIVEEPVMGEELSDNKSFFKGQLVLGLETNEGTAGSIQNMELYDLGLDYLQKYGEMIDSLTLADLQAATRHYLNPDAYAVGIAGPEISG